MSEKSIEQYDPSKVMNLVKDRIKATFVSLIPDVEWEKMVNKEVDDYFKRKEDGYRRNSPSDFECDVRNVLRKRVEEVTKEIIEKEYTTSGYNLEINENIKKIIAENASQIFENIIGNMFQNAINNMRNH